MNVKLTTQLNQFIKRQIKAGHFENVSEAICDGLRLLELREDMAGRLKPDFAFNGTMVGSDIEAMVFIVMMEAAKSAREDLRAIMEGVKAVNATKSGLREVISKIGHDIAENLGQQNGKPSLKFKPRGIGSVDGYHRMLIPYPNPELPGGVRLVRTDMHKGPIKNICVSYTIRDELKNKLHAMSEMGEMESLRLQMAMDRLSKVMSTLSNILKKIGDTQSSIVANLK